MMSDGMVITCSFLGHSISLAVLGGMLLVIIYQYQVSYHAQKSYLVLVVCRVMFVSVALPLTLKLNRTTAAGTRYLLHFTEVKEVVSAFRFSGK